LNIELPTGKSVALVGRNGAGKSTLLRMIGGIDRPDKGRILTDQTISWPVGLAGGFQGSLTGRENVKFVARLYAKKDELQDKVSFVEEFSELGKYFDMPIKTYSSGMRS
ncbi:ABC transporter ATP-binding protein, partial [Escherichia coli]